MKLPKKINNFRELLDSEQWDEEHSASLGELRYNERPILKGEILTKNARCILKKTHSCWGTARTFEGHKITDNIKSQTGDLISNFRFKTSEPLPEIKTSIEVDLNDFSKEELINIIIAANNKDITFNQFINIALENLIKHEL